MEKLIGEQSQELELNVTWDSLDGDCVPEEEHAELNRSPADGREAQGLPRIAAMEKDEEAVDWSGGTPSWWPGYIVEYVVAYTLLKLISIEHTN